MFKTIKVRMGFNYPHNDIRPEFTAIFMLELNIISFLLGLLTMIQGASPHFSPVRLSSSDSCLLSIRYDNLLTIST